MKGFFRKKRFCKNCGKSIPKGKTYCPYCENTFQIDSIKPIEQDFYIGCVYAPPEIMSDKRDEDTAPNAYPLNYMSKSENYDEEDTLRLFFEPHEESEETEEHFSKGKKP